MVDQVEKISQWLGTGSINIFGSPFAGKDTQAQILADLFGGIMISSGDVLRRAHDNKRIQEIMSEGEIIPSDLFEALMLPYLSRPEFRGKPLVLSEIGRVLGEERIIMEATANSDHPMKAVVLLQLSEEEVWRRFEQAKVQRDRGDRADDRDEVIKARLNEFQNKTLPVVEFYRNKGLLIEVDGTSSREEVTNQILEGLVSRVSMREG